jgi:hypothetical protein
VCFSDVQRVARRAATVPDVFLDIDWCCAVLYQTVQEQNDTICIRRNVSESVNLLNRDSVCANLTRIQSTGSESCAMENIQTGVIKELR